MTLLLKERAPSSVRNRQLGGIVHLHQSSRNKKEKHGGEGDTNHPETQTIKNSERNEGPRTTEKRMNRRLKHRTLRNSSASRGL